MVEPYPSEKYEFVNWDDEIPSNYMEKQNMFQTTNQTFIAGETQLVPESTLLSWLNPWLSKLWLRRSRQPEGYAFNFFFYMIIFY